MLASKTEIEAVCIIVSLIKFTDIRCSLSGYRIECLMSLP